MNFKGIAVAAAAAALCLGMAGSAMASPLSGKPKPPPQVTGSRLASALLPASSFGDGFTVTDHINTGNKYLSTKAFLKPSTMNCQAFEEYIFVGGFGDTAGAASGFENPNPALADFPNIVLVGDQAVLQFKTTQQAASFYNQAYAKYQKCSAFTEPDPADSTSVELTTQSLSGTTINKNKAFQLIQHADLSSLPALSFYENTAVVLSGANVYTIDDLNGTNDPISASLLGELINRVQALYKHH